MKTTLIKLRWDYNIGEAELNKTPFFEQVDQITKLDFLQDCIHDLTDLYDSLLTKDTKND